jgi:hypothetical protein
MANPIITGLDKMQANMEKKQIGENGHAEYAWASTSTSTSTSTSVSTTNVSTNNVMTADQIKELITQFQFQLVRNANIDTMRKQLNTILTQLTDNELTQEKKELLVIMYKLIGQTRDLNNGKGEYNLANMMILEWFQYYPQLAKFALSTFVETIQDQKHKAFGSWKDIKYLCLYIKNASTSTNHPLIQYSIELMNKQLKLDETILRNSEAGQTPILSLAAKWAARESSGKFGWLNKPLAEDYFKEFMDTAKTPEQQKRASAKCQTYYRKLLVKLNKYLDTIQIKQCTQRWAEIDHAKTTSITLKNQTKALLNLKKNGEERSHDPDRIECAANFRAFIETQKKEGKELKGSKVGMEQFTVKALELLSQRQTEATQQEIDILNSQWRDSGNNNNAKSLGPMIPMVDRSGSMAGSPQDASIALGCRIAEKSSLGKRAISFASNPEYLNLEHCTDFVSMVQAFVNSPVGYSTNFYAALDLILDTIEREQIPAEEVDKMVLILLSDMQINECISIEEATTKCEPWPTLYRKITQKYNEVGQRLYGAPLPVPHILFWNLRYTDGFPTLSTQDNATMMSGFNSQLLNEFCDKGIDALREYTPWYMFVSSHNRPEYDIFEQRILQELEH